MKKNLWDLFYSGKYLSLYSGNRGAKTSLTNFMKHIERTLAVYEPVNELEYM